MSEQASISVTMHCNQSEIKPQVTPFDSFVSVKVQSGMSDVKVFVQRGPRYPDSVAQAARAFQDIADELWKIAQQDAEAQEVAENATAVA